MSRSLRHGALAATAVVFSLASLSACGAGNDAETLHVRPDNAATAVGQIKIQNANVITQSDHNAAGPAVISATLFNNGPKQEVLQAITLPGTKASVQLHAAKGDGPVVVPAGGRVILGGAGNASAVIENGREAAQNGNVQTVVFKLSETGDVDLGVSVVPSNTFFKDFGPSSVPSQQASPSPSASASPSATASPATASPAGAGSTGQPAAN